MSTAMVIFSAPAVLTASRSLFLNDVGVIRVETLSPVPAVTSFTIFNRSFGAPGEVREEMHTRWMKLSFKAASRIAVITSERG